MGYPWPHNLDELRAYCGDMLWHVAGTNVLNRIRFQLDATKVRLLVMSYAIALYAADPA